MQLLTPKPKGLDYTELSPRVIITEAWQLTLISLGHFRKTGSCACKLDIAQFKLAAVRKLNAVYAGPQRKFYKLQYS